MDITRVKDLLLSYCKQNHYKSPRYKIIFITGDEYKKLYTVSVEIKGVLTAAESGISRRIAEKKAAIKALAELKLLDEQQIEELNGDNKLEDNHLKNDVNHSGDQQKGKDKTGIEVCEVAGHKDIEADSKVISNKNKNKTFATQTKTSFNTSANQNDIKFIDDNLNHNQKNMSRSANKPKTLSAPKPSKEANQRIFNIYDFDENSICALIKYCLRNQIPLPFYDFNFTDGLFCTQCKVESDGKEFIGYGRSSTLRSAKMMSSQEVIDQLKECGLYFVDPKRIPNNNKSKVLNNDFSEKVENHVKEYSSLTINMKTTDKKITDDKSKTLPNKPHIEDFDDDFTDRNYSTIGSRDDNNNRNESDLSSTSRHEWQKYHDYNIIIDNPVSYLQEFCSKNRIKGPKYERQERQRKDKCPFFTYRCLVNRNGKTVVGIGLADSKKSAKKAAAEEAIKKLLQI